MTFDRAVNIKEVCWNLQNIRVCMPVFPRQSINDCQSYYFHIEMCFSVYELCFFFFLIEAFRTYEYLNSQLLRLRALCASALFLAPFDSVSFTAARL